MEESFMPSHKFRVGQTVRLSPPAFDRGAAGLYRVVAHMPEERGDRQYRIQAATGGPQRVAWESQLSSVELA
jgi:hypothetical protein